MRHLRTLFDLEDKRTVERLLLRAQAQKRGRRDRRLAPTLSGYVVATLFERESTRTRISFEAGVAMLGGSCLVLQARDTQLNQGEPFRDAARVIGGYVDALVCRAWEHATLDELARHAGVPVINGLTDLDHPCQVLADIFTVFERREDPFSLDWAWVGEAGAIANGMVAAAALTGMNLRVAIPEGASLDETALARAKEAGAKVTVGHDPKAAVEGAHIVSTAAWQKAGGLDRDQRLAFQLNRKLLKSAADDHFVLHCLPARRGEEITDEVLEGRRSLAFDQAENRLPVQQAVLEWALDVPGIDQLAN